MSVNSLSIQAEKIPIVKLLEDGSKFVMFWLIRMFIVFPYCGVPRLSHQLPVEVVVTAVVVDCAAELVVLTIDVDVVLGVVTIEVVDVGVEVVVDELQDANNIVVTIIKLKPNQITLLFNFILHVD